MKILQLGKAYPPVNLGGVEVTIKLITEGLHKLGVECDVLGVNNKFVSHSEARKFGTIYREALIIKAFSTLFSIKLIYRLFLIKKKYDIIHIHHPDPMATFAIWLIKPKCKLIIHWHSDILRQKYLLKIFRPFQTWLLINCNAIICTSKSYADNSPDLRPYINKVTVIPIGIDNSKLIFDRNIVDQIKKRFFNKKIVLSIGRMSYYKGYGFLIEAVKYFNPNINLLIIGEGELKKELQEKVINENLSDQICFLGKVDDILRNSYLCASDVFVLSSIYKTEAFGIVQLEAMSFGKPIVSTKIPNSGVDWVNQNSISGLTVPICDPESIANAVNSIVENDELSFKLGKGSQDRFKSNFTQEIMIQSINKLYKDVLR
jgi:glycosyltransferase involved in cell wall biosynthesis